MGIVASDWWTAPLFRRPSTPFPLALHPAGHILPAERCESLAFCFLFGPSCFSFVFRIFLVFWSQRSEPKPAPIRSQVSSPFSSPSSYKQSLS